MGIELDGSVSSTEADPAAEHSQKTMRERRQATRHKTNAAGSVLMLHSRIESPGRVLDLSPGGCRIRMEQPFQLDIAVKVELEFYLNGMAFRVAGVSQQIVDDYTFGICFRDVSPRRREQLAELIEELAEAKTVYAATRK